MTSIQNKHVAQRGSTTLGIIVGVVLGLAVALGVSLYLAYSGAPVQTKAANTAARIEPPADASKAPDPNQSLYTKVPKADDAKAPDGKDNKETTAEPKATNATATPNAAPPIAPPQPAAIPVNKPTDQDGIGKIAAMVTPSKDASSKPADPLVMPKPANAAAGERYFVQAGAFANMAEAEAMKAKLALQGVSMTLSPRDKDGQILQRVRTAPLAAVDAERLRNTLKANGIETSLVKVQ